MDDKAYLAIAAMAEQAEKLQEQAQASQRQAEALLRKAQTGTTAATETMAKLLTGMAQLDRAFSRRHGELAERIAAFTKAMDQIGPHAFAGGQAAVAGEVRAAFKQAGASLAAASDEASAPARAAMTQTVAALTAAQASLEATAKRLSWKAAAILSGVGLAALAVMALGGYGFVAWQHRALEEMKQETSTQEMRLANLRTIVAEMEKKGVELDAKGVRFETTRCGPPNGKTRLCVAIDPNAPAYGADGRYRVPMGY